MAEKRNDVIDKCPKCNAKTKQFKISKEYEKSGYRGKYYCNKCGWMEGYSKPMHSLIKE